MPAKKGIEQDQVRCVAIGSVAASRRRTPALKRDDRDVLVRELRADGQALYALELHAAQRQKLRQRVREEELAYLPVHIAQRRAVHALAP